MVQLLEEKSGDIGMNKPCLACLELPSGAMDLKRAADSGAKTVHNTSV